MYLVDTNVVSEARKRTKADSFAEVLAAMPNVGRDEDFERRDDDQISDDVLG